MAGIVPCGKSGRKQWCLHDGPRGSLQRLRNQLAKDGCPESQVILAKQLLEESSELDVDKTENARTAVYWLIKSSEQGNEEATDLLKNCFLNGRGINEHNFLDVNSCINMAQDEKLARKAAREMFASLSNGEDFITSVQLQKRMTEIYYKKRKNKCCQRNGHITENEFKNHSIDEDAQLESENDHVWSQRVDIRNEKLTEENLVAAAVNYAHGELPEVNMILCLSAPDPHSLDHIPYFNRSILHPLQSLKIFYYRFIRFIGSQSNLNIFPFSLTNIQLLLFMLVYSMIGTESLLLFVPMILYYASFITMVLTSFQMFQCNHDFQDFRVWSGLFLLYSGGNLNSQDAEFQFIRNNLKPYGNFFLSLLINLMIYPIIATQWIPQSEFTITAFCLTFLSLITFMRNHREKKYPVLLLLFSFGVNVLAKYPYESDAVVTQGWRFLDLNVPSFTSYIIGNGIEFCLNFRFLLFLLIPVCLCKIAMKENWRGTYKYFIPHCVTLSWLQIAIISSQGATMYGLLRGTLALVGIVLFLPLAGLATVLLPIVALSNYIYDSDWFYTFIITLSFVIIFIVCSWMLTFTRYYKYITLIQMVIGIIVICSTVIYSVNFIKDSKSMNLSKSNNIYLPKYIESQNFMLSWEQYQNFCHQDSWELTNMAGTQLKCSLLDGVTVKWNGYITEIKVKKVYNVWKSIIDKMPSFMTDYLYCLFGEEYDTCESNQRSEEYLEISQIIKYNKKCHMTYWNKYVFEIKVKIMSGVWSKTTEVNLILENSFKNFTLKLKPNDNIWFVGTLTNNVDESDELIGGIRPSVNLIEIGCTACHNVELTETKIMPGEMFNIGVIIKYMYLGCKNVFNFLFNPIILFK